MEGGRGVLGGAGSGFRGGLGGMDGGGRGRWLGAECGCCWRGERGLGWGWDGIDGGICEMDGMEIAGGWWTEGRALDCESSC